MLKEFKARGEKLLRVFLFPHAPRVSSHVSHSEPLGVFFLLRRRIYQTVLYHRLKKQEISD
jgi:hypothetical protein